MALPHNPILRRSSMQEFDAFRNSSQPLSPDFATLPNTALAADVRERLQQFLAPLLILLDRCLDKRLVRTVAATLYAILLLRHRSHGLLLSELGAYLLSPDKAPAGTKRLSNLLRSSKWSSALLEQYLWQQAVHHGQQLEAEGQLPLLLWDESVIEKPESRKRPDLCPVRSSKATRLARSRPGPPQRPTFVNGLQWVSLLLIGQKGAPTVAAMRWFTTRGERQTDARTVQVGLLMQCVRQWKRRVLHVFDRGYAGTPWITACLENQVRFLMRWPKRFKLVDAQEQERAAWQILRGQPTWEERVVFDTVQNRARLLGVLALLVHHPEWEQPLWLVCARPKGGKGNKGQEPWLLLTTEPVFDADAAFALVLAYARRWQVELAFRFGKSELAMESPRVWTWERREKLLLL
ncbi:hypothetical protein FGG08_007653, partial [Glutinoglossum americanum]